MKEEITQEKISEWKTKYKFVYKVLIDGTTYYIRTLNRDDFQNISAKQQQLGPALDYELETVKTCLLNDIDDATLKAKAGIITTLSEKIMTRSGFSQVEEEEL